MNSNMLDGTEIPYFKDVNKMANYWIDNYAMIWSGVTDYMMAVAELTCNMMTTNLHAIDTSMQQLITKPMESSVYKYKKAARKPELMLPSIFPASDSTLDVDHIYSIFGDIPPGYKLEGHEGYVFTAPAPDRLPLYRFYNGSISDHYYNTYPDIPPGGYITGKDETKRINSNEGYVVVKTVDRTPLYRFYKPKRYDFTPWGDYLEIDGTDRYFYSTSPDIPAGYTFQGIEGYVATTPGQDKRQLHRFYNGSTDDHYYSTDAVVPKDYGDETGFDPNMFVFATPGPDRTQLYRGYTFAAGGASHYYSTSKRTDSVDFKDESDMDIMYVYASAGPNITPLYRFYSDSASDHYYSISPVVSPGYKFEGHTGYVMSVSDRAPFYRFYYPGEYDYWSFGYIPGTSRYVYSTNPAVPKGYTLQGIEGYVATSPGPGRIQLHKYYSNKKNDWYHSIDSTPPIDYEDKSGIYEPLMYVLTAPGPDSVHLNAGRAGETHFYTISSEPSSYPEGFEGELSLMWVYSNPDPNITPLFRYSYSRELEDDGDFFDDIGDFVSDVVNGVAEVVNTIVNPVREVVEGTVGWFVNAAGIIVEYFLAIPIVGRFIGWVVHIVQEIINFAVKSPDFILSMFGIRPEKLLKLLVIIQRDGQGVQVAGTDTVKAYIRHAISIFKNEANVRIIPARKSLSLIAIDDDSDDLDKYIYIEDERSDSETLDVSCKTAAAGEDLSDPGLKFQIKMATHNSPGAGRRIIGTGSPICAFSVRKFAKPTTRGCSLGPLSDYVTVQFIDDEADVSKALVAGRITRDEINRGLRIGTTLAHELGHACNLTHAEFVIGEDNDKDNLMSPGDSRPRGTSLSAWQISLLRSSRHVTY